MSPLLYAAAAWGQSQAAAPPEARRNAAEIVRPDVEPEGPLRVIALVQARAALTNVVSTNPFLDGQVLGTLGGTNGMDVDPEARSAYTEQRASGFFTWRPDVLDGKVGLNAAFEIDFAWGDRAYGVGGNTGGGFGGDQVNLQTRRLSLDTWSKLGATKQHRIHLVAGLQFVADSANDPSATTPDGLFRSGGRLMFFGSEAAGLSAYGTLRTGFGDRLRWRTGIYTLLELGLGEADDAWLAMADLTAVPAYGLEVGAHAWLLRDNTGGTGGALGAGPTSGLSEMQGGPRVNPWGDEPRPDGATVDATLVWGALDAGYNAALQQGPVGLHGIALLNAGSIVGSDGTSTTVVGQVYDVEVRARWSRGKGSIARVEALYSSPDVAQASSYTGVVTGNSYGFAAAIPNTHGTRLLFSDPQSINRMTPVIYDVSGAGLGVLGLTGSVGFDPIPNRLNATLGAGYALAPQRASYGTELNAELTWEPLPFFTPQLAGAVLFPGEQALVDDTAWVAYAGVEWLAF
jgi:hypothetical protein